MQQGVRLSVSLTTVAPDDYLSHPVDGVLVIKIPKLRGVGGSSCFHFRASANTLTADQDDVKDLLKKKKKSLML